MFFSSLATELPDSKNPLYLLRDDILASGGKIIDLVAGNVNEHGIVFPQHLLKDILAEAGERATIYKPDSLGQESARRAIVQFYSSLRVLPDQVLLTPGTSVSYWYCFRLLGEPGDEILCPRPSYPLFDYIAKLCGVQLTTYRLLEAAGWSIDLDYLEHQITTRTRAIVLISPHNPTGMVADADQLSGLAEIASRHKLPIIADEVFSEFLFGLESLPRPAATSAPLVFTLNGFSKMFALPGMKIGWVVISGDEDLVRKMMRALELISDTFLPVNQIAQFAVAEIFRLGQDFRRGYVRWIQECREAAIGALSGLSFVAPRGGFYLTAGTERDEEKAVLELLREEGILVHPGYFYDIEPNHLVMTFVHEPSRVGEVLGRIRKYLG